MPTDPTRIEIENFTSKGRSYRVDLEAKAIIQRDTSRPLRLHRVSRAR